MASTELASTPIAPAAEPPQEVQLTVRTYVLAVFGFNDKLQLFWRNPNPIPVGVTPVVYFIDRSGSIHGHVSELRSVVASFLRGTDAEGMVHVSGVSGPTGMVKALYEAGQRIANMAGRAIFCDFIFFTDGLENQFHGELTVGLLPGGESDVITLRQEDHNRDEYIKAVADHLTHVCGGKIYFLGIGADAERMAGHMIRRRNCYVAHVPRGVTTEQAMGIVNALRSESERLQIVDESGNGTESTTQQEVLRLRLSPEVEAAIAALDRAEVSAVVANAERMQVTHLALPEPWTTARLKEQIESVEAEVAKRIPRESFQQSRATLLFGMEAMCTASLPGAMLTGKHCALLEGDGSPTWGKFLNTVLSQLAPKGRGGVLSKDGTTPDAGAELKINGEMVNFAGKCALYKCNVPIEVVQELAKDEAWCAGQASLKRKRSAMA